MPQEIKDDSALEKVREQVEDFINDTIEARNLSERDRDYYDGYQWTDEESAILRARRQAPIVVNRVKPKVEGMKGLLSMRKTDIKAFPRNYKNDEKAAHAVTDALRYVFDANDYDSIHAEAFENKIVEGYCAVIVEVEASASGGNEIKINLIPWDRFYFDPNSRARDFKDARYMGQMMWLDKDQLVTMFPDKEAEIEDLTPNSASEDETFDDRPRWSMGNKARKRYRIAQHFYVEKSVWKMCVFTDGLFLVEPQDSPYADEDGQPSNPIEADSAYIDRNNNRYGEVRSYIDQQDEINHRRSKALHLLSARQTMARNGAIEDIDALKRELAKPNGHVQYNGDDGDFKILETSDMLRGQLEFYQDSKNEMDATSFNAQLSGERQGGDLSGKAIDRLQSAGALEINGLYSGSGNHKKRTARQVWARVKQFWNEEKWIRITDDQDNLRWVGLNSQITLQQQLEEIINDPAKPLIMRKGASAAFQTLMQAAENPQDPQAQAQAKAQLDQVVTVKNKVAELDVDVILEESLDVVNIENEQFDLMVKLATQYPNDIDVADVLELSQLRNKKQVIEKMEQRRNAASQASGDIAQAKAQELQVKNAKTFAETQKTTAQADQVSIQNQQMIANPPQLEQQASA